MYTFNSRAVDKNFKRRQWQRHFRNHIRLHLEGDIGLLCTVFVFLEVVSAQSSADQLDVGADDTVVIEVGDIFQLVVDLANHLLEGFFCCRFFRIKAFDEQLHQHLGNQRVADQRFFDVRLTKRGADLAHVLCVSTQDHHFPAGQASTEYQFVKAIIFKVATPDASKCILETVLTFFQIQDVTAHMLHVEVQYPATVAVTGPYFVGPFTNNAQAHVFEHRHYIRQVNGLILME